MTTWPACIPNRKRPSLWCRLLHQSHWASNDFGTWWTSGRTTYEIECGKCDGCWTWPHPVSPR